VISAGNKLAERFKGVRDGRRVDLADFVVAFMPTGYMLAVAKNLEGATGLSLYDLTNLALSLYEFQYNDPRCSIFTVSCR
jgi:hypothetical protein